MHCPLGNSRSTLGNNKTVDLICLEFQDTFDKLPYEMLILKVTAHIIQGSAAQWICNWLAGWSQRVSSTTPSAAWHQKHQVSHKEVFWAHCFFLIYIHDLDNGIVRKIYKFAEDTKLCHSVRYPDEVLELQKDLNRLVDWANKWQINFNADDCECCLPRASPVRGYACAFLPCCSQCSQTGFVSQLLSALASALASNSIILY